ncbi:MAG: UDP-3-O-(3-hydroxymyristoyl) glucosamine N-acyltransferase [Anaerospora sp.]|nr:UDP-3-O-(3-hydroxymyristoyl) glucosamine N-acyltransferase [Anaerospora sp.]
MKLTLQEIADLVNGLPTGDASIVISGVTNIAEAGPGDITFAVPPHLEKAVSSAAAAVIIPETVTDFEKPAIRVANPRLAFTTLLSVFTPPVAVARGVHPAAVLGENVTLGENVAILPHAVIADNVSIGNNTVIYPHTYIGADTQVGSDCLLYPGVSIREGCHIGSRVIIHLVHLAHNVTVGENCFFVAQTGIAGSTRIGNNVTFAGQSGCAGHITIGDHSVFAARSAPISDIPEKVFYAGFPARPHREWLRTEAAAGKVPDLLKKVRDLELRLAALEKQEK